MTLSPGSPTPKGADGVEPGGETQNVPAAHSSPTPNELRPPLGLRDARWFKVLRPVVALLAVLFAGVAFWKLLQRWDASELEIHWGYTLASALPLAMGSVALALGWVSLVDKMCHVRMPVGRALAVHFESQLGRYAPGKVAVPLVRMAAAPSLGVSAKIAGSSVFVETIGLLALGVVCGVTLLAATSGYAGRALDAFGYWGWVVVALLIVGTLFLSLLDRRYFPGFLRALLPESSSGALLPWEALAWYAVYWLGWALHGVLLSVGVGASPWVGLAGSGVFVLAPIVGFAALAAPAGLGVREAVLSIALAGEIGATAALAAAMLSRMVSIVAEVGLWLIARALMKPRP